MHSALKQLAKSIPFVARPSRWLLRKWRTLKSLNPRLISLRNEVNRLKKEVRASRLPNRVYHQLLRSLETQGLTRPRSYAPYKTWIDQARSLAKPAADLGCASGDGLSSLKSLGLYAVGVEYNAHLVQEARSRGLSVFKGDAIEWLEKQPGHCLSLIAACDLANHLPIGKVWRLLSLSHRVLAAGGILILESLDTDHPFAKSLASLDPGFTTSTPATLMKILIQTAGFELITELRPTDLTIGLVARKPSPECRPSDGTGSDPQRNVGQPQDAAQYRDLGPWAMEGPQQGSYSLAIVNRSLMASLSSLGQSTQETSPTRSPLICLRNDFPPKLEAGQSALTLLANYAWEETGYPNDWVHRINQNLQAVTVCSPLVKKILREAGVRRPIAVVGNGVEPQVPLTAASNSRGGPGSTVFRFLHISTGLRRKGLDLLIQAFDALGLDQAELVIKTTTNPTNELPRLLQERETTKDLATPKRGAIRLIDHELSDQQMADLIASSDVLVLPSRAEGFGLPIAEAAMLGIPSIVPQWGGHRCFATPQNAWLVKSPLVPAKSHLNELGIDGLTLEDSVWCEPDVADLCDNMRQAIATSIEDRQAMAASMAQLLREMYCWQKVAQRTVRTVEVLLHQNPVCSQTKLGWVSTYNSRCGIATYSENLIQELPNDFFGDVSVYANLGAQTISNDREKKVRRCWNPQDFNGKWLSAQLVEDGCGAVVIQHNAALFPTSGLSDLVKSCSLSGMPCFVDLHNTRSLLREWSSRPEITTNLGGARRLFVHSIADLNNLAQVGLRDNVCLLPHGVYPPASPAELTKARRAIEEAFKKRPGLLLGCFGFALPHKGFQYLIRAVAKMRSQGIDVGLLMLCAEHPHSSSQIELAAMRSLIDQTELGESVVLRSDFIAQSQAIGLLAQTDLTVYPYDPSEESASGAVRMAIAAGRPILSSPIAIFEDLDDVVQKMTSNTVDGIVEAVTSLVNDSENLARLARQTIRYRQSHQWPIIASRLANIMQGDLTDPFPDDLLTV